MRIPGFAFVLALAFVAVLCGAACAKNSGGSKPPKKGAVCRPDKLSRIPKLEPKTDAERFCAQDSDCVATMFMVGSCCGHGCNGRSVFTSAFLKRLSQHRLGCCEGHKYSCKMYSCPQATTRVEARCLKRRCVGVQVPIRRPRPRHVACRPDNLDRIPKLIPTGAAETTCASDSDCVVSQQIPGSCCSNLCSPGWVHTRTYNKRLLGYTSKCCRGHTLSCPDRRCKATSHRTVARCVSQRCVAKRVPEN